MDNENPYMAEMERCSDEELFEILSFNEERDIVDKYVAAISIALNRELISEYQSLELLEGNTMVLEYNPDNVSKDIVDYQVEEQQRVEERKHYGISKLHYGILMCLCGVILLLLSQSSGSVFPGQSIILGFIALGMGVLLIIKHFLQSKGDSN